MNRRKSLKLISALPLLAAFPSIALAEAKKVAKAVKGKLIDEKDPLAGAMQYKHDASKVGSMRSDKKAFCDNCDKYNKCMPATKSCKPLSAAALKKAGMGPCSIFAAGDVKAKGWCLSWQPIAKK